MVIPSIFCNNGFHSFATTKQEAWRYKSRNCKSKKHPISDILELELTLFVDT
jgi:hypothetical protein